MADRQNTRTNPPIAFRKVFHPRKKFFVDLHSNERGHFIRLSEQCNAKRDTIIIPTESVPEIIAALQEVMREGGVG